MNKGEVKKIASEEAERKVHDHEYHMHHGIVPTKFSPHVTIISHSPTRHIVHNDHTGHSSEHSTVERARAAARQIRKGEVK